MNIHPKNCAIVVNPAARCGHCLEIFNHRYKESIGNILQFNPPSHLTRSKSDCLEMVSRLESQGVKYLFYFGGDGTTNDLIQKISPKLCLLPFPLGSANDFCRRVGYLKPEDSLDGLKYFVANSGRNLKTFDLGEASQNDKPLFRFINHFGVGATARCIVIAEKFRLKLYLLTGLFSILTAKPFDSTLTFGSKTLKGTGFGFEFLLTPKVGKIIHIAPYKIENTQNFSLFYMKNLSLMGKLNLIFRMPLGVLLERINKVILMDSTRPSLKPHEPLPHQRNISLKTTPQKKNSSSSLFETGSVSCKDWSHIDFHMDGNLIDSNIFTSEFPVKVKILPRALSVIHSNTNSN